MCELINYFCLNQFDIRIQIFLAFFVLIFLLPLTNCLRGDLYDSEMKITKKWNNSYTMTIDSDETNLKSTSKFYLLF